MKRKIGYLVMSLMMISSFGLAQESKFYFGIGGGVDFYDYDFNSSPVENFEHSYSETNGYSLGFRVNFGPTKKIRFSTGAYFSEKGYKLVYDWGTAAISSDTTNLIESVISASYIDIPVSFNYRLIGKDKFHISPSLGLMLSLNLTESEYTVEVDGTEVEATTYISDFTGSSISDVLLGGKFGLIIGVNANKKVFFALEPYVIKSFIAIDSDAVESTPVNFGGVFSVNFRVF